ncbi:hypothetical protein [Pseudobacteroides cellulosolvens]|uniref:Uncharacterized protein n=1 Tax=Pseudobacteroides cellulosolvens ATCC 35603 = DSM 2933 TaxID=398512 RepID=A0A0L6JSG1_9FIRM|nr:hypothetical protein [Pseudobacteroides cellulosolvens]KNY28352.1 hypothetical protein Bccel_3626 [Pseudobacteroides cellulosolvens ATCC 35603 = DSM 2933]
MSIKPIDFQVMIPKTAEVSKAVNDDHQKNLGMNQNNADRLQHKSENEVKTVHSQGRTSGPEIKDNKDREKKNKKESKKNREKMIRIVLLI